jgi:hypothetical protein
MSLIGDFKMKTATIGLLGSALALSGGVMAAPNIANNTQQGSLLVFPRIDVTDGKTTIVRLTNTGNRGIGVKCHYVDFNGLDRYKNSVDFVIRLTKTQAVAWDAYTGEGDGLHLPSFPKLGSNTGELICWAANVSETSQKAWNQLSGTAEVFDTAEDRKSSYKYTAAAYYDRNPAAPVPGLLALDGSEYDKCGKYLIGHFSPVGAQAVLRDTPATYARNQISVSSCTQDVSPQGEAVWKGHFIDFDVYNADEIKFTGAREYGDSWLEVDLQDAAGSGVPCDSGWTCYDNIDRNGDNFLYSTLGTFSAMFVADSSEGYGLTGVMVTDVLGVDQSEENDLYQHATNLNTAGSAVGYIAWKPGLPVPESMQ